jgi:hypothetical protein
VWNLPVCGARGEGVARFRCAFKKQQRKCEKQIPFGDDNQKDNDNQKTTARTIKQREHLALPGAGEEETLVAAEVFDGDLAGGKGHDAGELFAPLDQD